jgi:hypothetical protein
VVEWSRALDIRLSDWCCSEFKSRRGKNKNLTAQKSNSNTVWFNFQTYVIFIIIILLIHFSIYILLQ